MFKDTMFKIRVPFYYLSNLVFYGNKKGESKTLTLRFHLFGDIILW